MQSHQPEPQPSTGWLRSAGVAFIVVLVAVLVVASFTLQRRGDDPANEAEATVIVQFVTYMRISTEQMIDDSDLIFIGTVTAISPTNPNSTVQTHTLTFQPERYLVNTFNLDEAADVTITVGEANPTEAPVQPAHNLAVGNTVLFFAQQRNISGLPEGLFVPTTQPSRSYFLRGEDGLYSGTVVNFGAGGLWNEKAVAWTEEEMVEAVGR